jgi:hypothetical protein
MQLGWRLASQTEQQPIIEHRTVKDVIIGFQQFLFL